MHLIKKKNLPPRLHIHPHCAGSTLSELHFLYFLFHCGKVGLVVVRRCKQQHPPQLLSSAILCSSLLLSRSKFMLSWELSIYFTVFSICLFFFLRQEVQCHRSNAPPPPSALPSVLQDGQGDRRTLLSFSAFYLSNLPPSVLPDGGQCGRSFVQQRECSPELTISPRLPECCWAPLCSVRGELTPMSEPNE